MKKSLLLVALIGSTYTMHCAQLQPPKPPNIFSTEEFPPLYASHMLYQQQQRKAHPPKKAKKVTQTHAPQQSAYDDARASRFKGLLWVKNEGLEEVRLARPKGRGF